MEDHTKQRILPLPLSIKVIESDSEDEDETTGPDSKSLSPLNAVYNHVIPMKCAVRTIVTGFNRRFRMSIPEIDNLCIAYYGADSRKLIHFGEHGEWFSRVTVDHSILPQHTRGYRGFQRGELEILPLTQYIDENFQIAYGYILGFQWIEWSGFLCIDLRTQSVRKLRCGINGKPVARKYSLSDAYDIEGAESQKRFDLLVSDELTESLTKHTMWERQELREREKYRPWITFAENLWSLFILNKLYIPSADGDWMQQQPIWGVIQFLSVLYFAGKLKKDVVVPQIQFAATWPFSTRSIENIFNDRRVTEFESKSMIEMETGITRYQSGESMRAVCYLAADWGGGYHCIGGYDRNLYLATFEIGRENELSEVEFRMHFQVAKSMKRRSVPLS